MLRVRDQEEEFVVKQSREEPAKEKRSGLRIRDQEAEFIEGAGTREKPRSSSVDIETFHSRAAEARAKAEEEALPYKDKPLSFSPLDMMLAEGPQAIDEFQRKRESKEKARLDVVGADEFSFEYEDGGRLADQAPEDTTRSDFITADDIAASPKAMKMIERYMSRRVSKEEADPSNYESKRDYVDKYLEYSRYIGSNSLDMSSEVGILLNTKDQEELADVAMLYKLNEQLPDFKDMKMKEVMSAAGDYALGVLSDPLNYVGIGSGFLVNQAAKKATGSLVRNVLPAMIASQGIEGTLAFWDDANRQQARIQTGLQDEFSFSQSAVSVFLNNATVAGFDILGASAARKSAARALDEKSLNRLLGDGLSDAAQRREDILNERMGGKVTPQFDEEIGRQVREDLSRGDLFRNLNTGDRQVVEPELLVEVQRKLSDAMSDLITNNQTARKMFEENMKKGQRVTDVVRTMIRQDGGEVIAADLQIALDRAGVTNAQFAEAFRGSISDAARTLQTWGAFKKRLDILSEGNPTLAESIKDVGSDQVKYTFLDRVRAFDKGIRSILVSAPITTMRNIISNTGHMTVDTFNDLMDNVVESTMRYSIDGSLDATGQRTAGSVGKGLKDSAAIAWGNLGRVFKVAEQDEIVNRLLKDHDSMKSYMLNFVQDAGDTASQRGVTGKVLDSIQVLNRWQDQFFRKQIFNNRVDYHLRRQGKGTLADYLATGRPVDTKILQTAMEEAMDRTFSKTYKKGTSQRAIIDAVEATAPLSTFYIPFPRFTMNALDFMGRNSALGLGEALLRGGKEMGELEIQKRNADIIKGMTGTAAMAGMYWYAAENPDEPWDYFVDDQGGRSDVKSIGPIAMYKLAGKVMHDLINNPEEMEMTFGELWSAVTGLQLTKGSAEWSMAESLLAMRNAVTGEPYTPEQLSIMEKAGFTVGDYLSRGTQTFAWMSDVIAAANPEEGIVRNRRISEDEGFIPAMLNVIQNRIPIAKRGLEPSYDPTIQGEQRKFDTLGTMVTGFRREAPKPAVATEIERAGIDSWTIAPFQRDRELRDMVVQQMQPLILAQVQGRMFDLMESGEWQTYGKKERRKFFKNWMSEIVTPIASAMAEAKTLEKATDKVQAIKRLQKNAWGRLSADDRAIVNQRRKAKGLPTVEQSEEWLQGAQEALTLEALM